jgi:NitT/TauT family transport system ATP-binding protein
MDIKFSHISKQFEDKLVLNDVNIIFLEGRINCLMGASGIGKTTMINIMLGLIKPDAGKVTGCKNSKIAVVFQEDRLIEHWDGVKNVRLVCEKSISIDQIEQEFRLVGLEDHRDKPVKEYSGGMRRRVALVRAMLAKSDIIILDEPFKGLDDILKRQVIQYVKQNSQGKTVIVVTHDKEEVQLLEANLILLQ